MTATDLALIITALAAVGIALAFLTLMLNAGAERAHRARRRPQVTTVDELQAMLRDDTDRPDFRAHSADTKADAAYHGWDNR